MKLGAFDYIAKPLNIEHLLISIRKAMDTHRLTMELSHWRRQHQKQFDAKLIVGESESMRALFSMIEQVAKSNTTSVLIEGESGTGKELVAHVIHNRSPRSGGAFMDLNCASLPEELLESELFGHERGAFTDAKSMKNGLLELADGGTLFLDEVGELPSSIQGSFLRALQERRFRPVGSVKEVASDFRLIAASNRNLDEMVREGRFRKDLLFRLRIFTIALPPLREHPGDIKELASSYLTTLSMRSGKGMKGFSPEFLDTLLDYDWPGNVRELVNALERAIAAAGESPTLFPAYLPAEIRIKVKRSQVGEEAEGTEALHPSGAPGGRRCRGGAAVPGGAHGPC
jgi:two-component system NtrC family response regulator